MTSKDKTGDQLVASIRKSKSGAVARKAAGRPAAGKSARAPEPAATPAQGPAGQGDGYSLGRRVWPD
ncbi:MAG: hypothetical protein R3F42_16090 [Pseudomonadota bacterium]